MVCGAARALLAARVGARLALATWGSGPKERGDGLRPPPVWFYFVSSVWFGPQGPKSFLFAEALLCCPLGSYTHVLLSPQFFSPSFGLRGHGHADIGAQSTEFVETAAAFVHGIQMSWKFQT